MVTTRDLETILTDMINRTLPRMPRYRYWRVPKGWERTRYAIGWTTERDHKGKFYAFKYRILANGNWKLIKKVAFGRRKKAKERSLKWHQEYYADLQEKVRD